MATFAARKTLEVAELCRSIAGVELMVAAQAAQSRKATPLGAVTGKLFALMRETVPFAAAGDRVPHLDSLLRHIEARRDEIGALIGAND
jgi:histidine ammonia-lyase